MIKIKRLIKKYSGKIENNNTNTTFANHKTCISKVKLLRKVSLLPTLWITIGPIRVNNTDVYIAIKKKKSGTSLTNRNIQEIIALPMSLIMTINNIRICQNLFYHSVCRKYFNLTCFIFYSTFY